MNNSQPKILLLDDEPFMLNLLSQILAQLGYSDVTKCDNGPQALQYVGRVTMFDQLKPAVTRRTSLRDS